MYSKIPSNPKEVIKATQIIFYSLIIGMLLFSAVIFGVSRVMETLLTDKSVSKIFLVVVLFFSVLSIGFGEKLYKDRMKASHDRGLPAMEKLNIHRAGLIFYLALCEGSGLFSMLIFFLTQNKLFLVITGFMLLAMVLKRPTKEKIFNDLQLNASEQMELN